MVIVLVAMVGIVLLGWGIYHRRQDTLARDFASLKHFQDMRRALRGNR